MRSPSRRAVLKLLGAGAALLGWPRRSAGQDASGPALTPTGRWDRTHDRVWLGEEYWANPMEDWRVVNGAAECLTGGGDRNVHLLTHQLEHSGAFAMAVRITRAEAGPRDGGAGFRVGVRGPQGDHKSACFARSGLAAGLVGGRLVIGETSGGLDAAAAPEAFDLRLEGAAEGADALLTLTAAAPGGAALGRLTARVPFGALRGNVALVSNFDRDLPKDAGARYRFAEWAVGGDAFQVSPEHRFGPILWSMYAVSDTRSTEGFVMKMSALTAPLGADDSRQVELQAERGGGWAVLGSAELHPRAWVATFRIPRWDAGRDTRFRLVYRERHRGGGVTAWERTGVVRANPEGRPLRLGALTCQKDYAFPYAPVAENLLRLDPDMVFFAGDQLYEDHGGYGLIRRPAGPAILNYLRKYYQHGWAFGEVMRDRPTLCLPDDHDVFHGNLWGEGGAAMPEGTTSSEGGYIEPPEMVNVVHRTHNAHHPDPVDPEPGKQGISVYFGEMVWGGVGFAILSDRQFKSGPGHVQTGGGRADHVEDADFDTSALDVPGLELLGERQEAFLRRWVKDWDGHAMKVVLSQTPFAGVATHHGAWDGYLKADLDSNSWPQTARNRAVDILREAMPLHVNGDQHLTSLVQYGTARARDAFWSFCVPAIAVGYPRWWRPDELGIPHENRPAHGLPDTGEFRDGMGNHAYVYAIGNPEVESLPHPYERAHQKGSGFGLVTIDPGAKTYRCESFRFLVDATDGRASNQFPGWPLTLRQRENRGENAVG